jgi:hypothetical protein
MVELVILACLMKDPSHCESFHVPFFEPVHMMECLFKAQIFMGKWSEDHPQWVVKRWRCTPIEA